MNAKNFCLIEIPPTRLRKDLHAEFLRIQERGDTAEIAGVVFLDEDERELPQIAEAVFCPEAGRIGIAWGADAQWADADSLEDGLRRYLGEGEWVN